MRSENVSSVIENLVSHTDKEFLKNKYNLTGKKVLSTFALLNAGRSIETTLKALPAIIELNPDVMFLIIGKSQPSLVKQEGYKYRNMLDALVTKLQLQDHVRYVNYNLPATELLEHVQLTDIYILTNNDSDRTVNWTFLYALECGCPVISTPIPYVVEVLHAHSGVIIDFENVSQLSAAANNLLAKTFELETLQRQ